MSLSLPILSHIQSVSSCVTLYTDNTIYTSSRCPVPVDKYLTMICRVNNSGLCIHSTFTAIHSTRRRWCGVAEEEASAEELKALLELKSGQMQGTKSGGEDGKSQPPRQHKEQNRKSLKRGSKFRELPIQSKFLPNKIFASRMA